MKHRFSILLCLILALFLLAGCGEEPIPTEPSEPPAPPATAAPAPTEPPLPALDPIHVVDAVVYDAPYGFQLLNQRTAAVIRYEYGNDDTESVTHLDIVDLYDGAVTATTVLDDSDYLPSQSPEGGLILLANYTENHFRVLDPELHTVRVIPVPNTDGLFNADLSRYYYESGGILSVMDTATGSSAPVPAAAGYRFSSLDAYDARENTLLGMVKTTLYGYDSCSIILNPDTGEIHLLSQIYGIVQPSGDGVCATVYDEENLADFLRYTDSNADTFFEIPSQVFGGSNIYLAPVMNSDYFLANAYTEEATTACDLYHIGETVTVCRLDMSRFPEGLLSLSPSSDGNLVGMQRYGDGYCFCILCPDQLPFEEVCRPTPTEIPLVDPTVLDTLAAEQNLPLSEDLTQLRARADALEEAYGITILLSGQCEIPASYCEYPVTTTDRAEWMDEAYYIETSLTELETTLRMYPAGFFRQFRNEAGEYGLLILLVEDINSANNAIGVHYTLGEWYCIAVDISYFSAVDTYCHEIWHATEARIHDTDYSLLGEEVWSACNPEGFAYSYDYTMDYLDHTEWTFLDGSYGAESYFVDSYARVDEREDRARLMEYIMAREDMADELMAAPALRQKLRVICDAIRQVFDTTGWKNVRWERYLTNP